MPYFITIYIHPMQGNIPHAFLGITRKHLNKLDTIKEVNEIKCSHGGVVQLKFNLDKEVLKNFEYNQPITNYHWSIENAA